MVAKKEEVYSKYEKARMVGSRALQISMGAPFTIKLSKKELEEIKFNPVEIAKKEFEAGSLPLTVVRPYPKPDLLQETVEKA